MKYIDLHLHLDGSLRTDTVLDLANNSNILIPQDKLQLEKLLKVSDADNDLIKYLSKFALPIKLMQTEENLFRVGYEIIEDLAKEGHIYAEIRFAPQLHTNQNLSESSVIKAVNNGMKKASEQYKMPYGIIVCAMRHNSIENASSIIDIANKNIINNVVGVDLAGDEFNFAASIFKDSFSRSELPITIHAGEARGADSVLDAINLGASRIGHGIRSIENLDVVDKLIKKDITLEICPISNQDTNVYSTLEEYPIKRLLDWGVKIAVCTDNKTVSNTNMKKEHKFLKENFNFKKQHLNACLNSSINGIFSSDSIKSMLRKKISSNLPKMK